MGEKMKSMGGAWGAAWEEMVGRWSGAETGSLWKELADYWQGGQPEGLAERALRLGVDGIEREFLHLHQGIPGEDKFPLSACQDDRNRYKDIGCWEDSRVPLLEVEGGKGPNGDFVHASWVDGARWPREFICTQAPTDSTAADFWQMVWERQVALVFMLCLCSENSRTKSSVYWPLELDKEMEVDRGIRLVATTRQSIHVEDQHLVETRLRLYRKGEGPRHLVHLVHVAWPDRGLPRSSAPMLKVVGRVGEVARETARLNGWAPEESPKLVHCSAGVGRTGTLVALDVGLAVLAAGGRLLVPGLVARLRLQRRLAVQNSHQYLYVYQVLLQGLLLAGPSSVALPGLLSSIAAALAKPQPTFPPPNPTNGK